MILFIKKEQNIILHFSITIDIEANNKFQFELKKDLFLERENVDT